MQQAIMVRRAVAGVAILIVVIVLAVGVHSCQVSSRNSALRSYNTTVGSLIQQSDNTGKSVFNILTTTKSSGSQQSQTELDVAAHAADSQLQQAQSLSPPSEVSAAQQNFVLALSLRHSGIADIAANIQVALTRKTAKTGVDAIATDMERFLASDVVYTTQAAPDIAAALNAAGIPVGGTTGENIPATSFLSDLGWLTPSYIAGKLGTSASGAVSSSSGPNPCPSVCGHRLDSVSVGGVNLSTGGGNTIPASPPPTFTTNFTNTGTNTETHVVVQVSVAPSSGATITGQGVEATTQAGQPYSLQITLSKSPPTGSAQVTVTVEGVPGETNLANNKFVFPVTFA